MHILFLQYIIVYHIKYYMIYNVTINLLHKALPFLQPGPPGDFPSPE